MRKTPGRSRSRTPAGDSLIFKKEFWLQVTFIMTAGAFTTVDKIHLITFLSDRPFLISMCATYMTGSVVKREPKFFGLAKMLNHFAVYIHVTIIYTYG